MTTQKDFDDLVALFIEPSRTEIEEGEDDGSETEET